MEESMLRKHYIFSKEALYNFTYFRKVKKVEYGKEE